MSVGQNNAFSFDKSQKYFKAPYTSPKTRQLGVNKKLTHEVDYLRDQIEEMAGLTIKNKLRIGELEAANCNLNIFIQENYRKHSTEKLRMMIRREMKAKLTMQSELIEIKKRNENLASANFELNEIINGMKTKLTKRQTVVESDPNTQLLKDTIVNLKAGFAIREKSLLQQINKQQEVICYLRNCISSNGDTLRKVTEGVCTQLVEVEDLIDMDIKEEVNNFIDQTDLEYFDLEDESSEKDTHLVQLQVATSPTSSSSNNLILKELENKLIDYQEMVELLEAECIHYKQNEIKMQQDNLILKEMLENSKKSHVNELQNKITEVLRQNSMTFLDVELEEGNDKDIDLELQFEDIGGILENESPIKSTVAAFTSTATATENVIVNDINDSSNESNYKNAIQNNSNNNNTNTLSSVIAVAIVDDKITHEDDKIIGHENDCNVIECRQEEEKEDIHTSNEIHVNVQQIIEVTDATDNVTADDITTLNVTATTATTPVSDNKTNGYVNGDHQNDDNQNQYTTQDILTLLNDLEVLQNQYLTLENEKDDLNACLSEADEIIIELKQLHESLSEENKQLQLNEKQLIHKIDEQDKEILGLKIKLRMTFSWTNANYDPLSPSNNKYNSSNGNNISSASKDVSDSELESNKGGDSFTSNLLSSDHNHYFVISDDEDEEDNLEEKEEDNNEDDNQEQAVELILPVTTTTATTTPTTTKITNSHSLVSHNDHTDVILSPLTTGNTIFPPFPSLHTSELTEDDEQVENADVPSITTIAMSKNSSSSSSSSSNNNNESSRNSNCYFRSTSDSSEIDNLNNNIQGNNNNNYSGITNINYTKNANQILLLEEMIELLETDIQSYKQKELYLLQENDVLKDIIEEYENKWNAVNATPTTTATATNITDHVNIITSVIPITSHRVTVNNETQTEWLIDSILNTTNNFSDNIYYNCNSNNLDILNLINSDSPKINSQQYQLIINNNSNNLKEEEDDDHDNSNNDIDDNDSDASSIIIVFDNNNSNNSNGGDISRTSSHSQPQYHNSEEEEDMSDLVVNKDTERYPKLTLLPSSSLSVTQAAAAQSTVLPPHDGVGGGGGVEIELDWKDFNELQLLLNHGKEVDQTLLTTDTTNTTSTSASTTNENNNGITASSNPTPHHAVVTSLDQLSCHDGNLLPTTISSITTTTTTTTPPQLLLVHTPEIQPVNELQTNLHHTSTALALAQQELDQVKEQSILLATDNSTLKYEIDLRNIRIKFLEDVIEELNTDLSELQRKVLDYEMIQKEIGIKIIR